MPVYTKNQFLKIKKSVFKTLVPLVYAAAGRRRDTGRGEGRHRAVEAVAAPWSRRRAVAAPSKPMPHPPVARRGSHRRCRHRARVTSLEGAAVRVPELIGHHRPAEPDACEPDKLGGQDLDGHLVDGPQIALSLRHSLSRGRHYLHR
jgi:hypothetical protein